MPKKQRKVKRYRNIYRGSITSSPVFKAGAVVAGVAVVAAAGWLLYEPVYNWATNLGESVSQGSSSQTAEPSSSGGMLDGFLGGEEGSSSQSVPEATDPAAAQTLHAVYMPESILMDASARSSFIADCVANGYNSIYFDLKDSAGVVTYRSGLSQITELGSASASAVDLASVVSEMKNAGITPIGRIYAFQDPLAAAANLDAAVHYQDSEWAWLDNSASLGGQPWLNPVSDYAQQYIMDLAREAAAAGVQQIVLDAVTFPVGYSLEMASYGRTLSDAEKSQVLADFIAAVGRGGASSRWRVRCLPFCADTAHREYRSIRLRSVPAHRQWCTARRDACFLWQCVQFGRSCDGSSGPAALSDSLLCFGSPGEPAADRGGLSLAAGLHFRYHQRP